MMRGLNYCNSKNYLKSFLLTFLKKDLDFFDTEKYTSEVLQK